jgi:hypothetical protein
MRRLLCLFAIVAAACGTPSGDDDTPPGDDDTDELEGVVYLSPTDHLVRASMMLRGARPSIEELERVAADPDALPAIVDTYLDSPAFGAVMRDLHNETLLLRVEQPQLTLSAVDALAGRTFAEINGSLFEEPLRLIEHVVTNDLPYTEIVTADYTLADGIVAAAWGLPYTGDGASWEVTTWNDGRPAAGILSSSALYLRHRSAGQNFHRGRANVITRGLLCHDYLAADIMVDTSIDLSDPDVVSNAVRTNASCAGCHQTLDPIGSFLFGFRGQVNVNQVTTYPLAFYDTDTERRWRGTTGRPPGFFGQPGERLGDLGRMIADDPRFAQCTARRFAAYFTQVELDELPIEWIAQLGDDFAAGGFDAKALARAIVLSDHVRVSHATESGDPEHVVGMLRTRPEQLDLLFRDLTGFRWLTDSTRQVRDMPAGRTNLLRADFIGFRALAGGIDGYFVTDPTHTTNAVSSLVLRTLAAEAADHVVDADLAAPPGERRLLTLVEATDRDPETIRAQLAALHARIYGRLDAADSAAVAETYALFEAALGADDDVVHAWKITLTAMLSDLSVAYH